MFLYLMGGRGCVSATLWTVQIERDLSRESPGSQSSPLLLAWLAMLGFLFFCLCCDFKKS